MWKYVSVLSILVLVGLSASAQQSQKSADEKPAGESKIPPEAAAQTNPVKPNPESIAQGKKVYGFDCAMCHGVDGDGKGDLAVEMKLKIADYRDPASLKDKTDGELFYLIQKGKGDMPPEGDRVKTDGLWSLVNYIRSFAKKGASPQDKPPSP